MPRSARVRLARTIRWATVGSGSRNARAISAVLRPHSRRRVSATRASAGSTGWQATNSSRSRSSPMSSSTSRSWSRTTLPWWSGSCAIASCLPACRRRWRSRSIARRWAVVISHAAGLSGTPCRGQCSSAATSASWASSSALSRSPSIRARRAIRRGDSMRHTVSSLRCISRVSIRPRSHHRATVRASARAVGHASTKALNPPQNMRLPSNGTLLASMPARRGSAMARALTRSRCARER